MNNPENLHERLAMLRSTEPKLCPFRKIVFGETDGVKQYLSNAKYLKEEFQPCLREKCAVWSEKMGACSY